MLDLEQKKRQSYPAAQELMQDVREAFKQTVGETIRSHRIGSGTILEWSQLEGLVCVGSGPHPLVVVYS